MDCNHAACGVRYATCTRSQHQRREGPAQRTYAVKTLKLREQALELQRNNPELSLQALLELLKVRRSWGACSCRRTGVSRRSCVTLPIVLRSVGYSFKVGFLFLQKCLVLFHLACRVIVSTLGSSTSSHHNNPPCGLQATLHCRASTAPLETLASCTALATASSGSRWHHCCQPPTRTRVRSTSMPHHRGHRNQAQLSTTKPLRTDCATRLDLTQPGLPAERRYAVPNTHTHTWTHTHQPTQGEGTPTQRPYLASVRERQLRCVIFAIIGVNSAEEFGQRHGCLWFGGGGGEEATLSRVEESCGKSARRPNSADGRHGPHREIIQKYHMFAIALNTTGIT